MEKKPSPFTVFQDLAKQKGYRPKRATTSLKKENVQFIFQTPSQKDIEVDVKTKKRFKNKSFDKWIWIEFANKFVQIFGLERNQYTTQIDHYDNYSIIFDIFKRINVILIDMCQDIWLYISRNIITQKSYMV